MNIVIANTQEFNPQIGGVERVSSTLAMEFKQLGHSVYFVAQKTSPYSRSYQSATEQYFLPNHVIADCDENVEFLTSFIINQHVNIVLNQAGNIFDFSHLCIKVRKQSKFKLISVIHTNPQHRIKAYQDHSFSLLPSHSSLYEKTKTLLKRIYIPKLLYIKKKCSKLYGHIYKNSDYTVLLSEGFKSGFFQMTGINDVSKLRAIVNPLSFQFNGDTEYARKKKQVLYVGRLSYYDKRPDRLLQIWSYIEKKCPEWNLLFVGDGPDRKEMERLTQKLDLRQVQFCGFTSPFPVYEESSIICCTSTIEGLPMILLEAMQFGNVPIAFESFESLHDVIDDGINGYIIKPFDLGLYAQRLLKLMTDDALRKKMSEEAKQYVSEKFAINKIMMQWTHLFDECMKEYYLPDEFEKSPKFDAHVHYNTYDNNMLKYASSINMHLLTLNTDYGFSIDKQFNISRNLKNKYPDLIDFLGTFDPADFTLSTFVDNSIVRIEKCMKAGAKGIKIWKNIGMNLRDLNGRYVMVDDPVFAPIFAYLEKKGITLVAHLGEPRNCWLPYEKMTVCEDVDYYKNSPEYHMYQHPNVPNYEQQIAARDHILGRYPKLKVVGAHIGSLEWNIDEISDRLDQYPMFYIDISGRMGHIHLHTIQNRKKVHRFFNKFQDRILYGSDSFIYDDKNRFLSFVPRTSRKKSKENNCLSLHQTWQNHWLFFATDENLPVEKTNLPDAPETMKGLQLPKHVVDKIFYENACKVYDHEY